MNKNATLPRPFYVECIGHRWGSVPVSFATEAEAIVQASRMASDAMRTTVYDCSEGPVGRVVLVVGRDVTP